VEVAVKFYERRMSQEGEQNRPRDRHQEGFEDLVKLPCDERKETEEENLYYALLIHRAPSPSREF
jgi:hypothetical protein